ncbi:peptidase U32 family protein [Fusobacterium sp. CAG:439]|nr:peptidase U32 family protein [Fusobacterium sp. CAG:439]
MKKVELLAPAKDKKTAIAAINSGCDAIYIGASNFGARKKVPNSLEDIKEIVDYAHKFYVKVHVTVNTVLTDDELFQAKELIRKLYDIGVDAVIVQDMGIFKLALDGELPPIVLHASTQCDNRTLEKVKFFDNMGISRVILARELSLEQIKEICQNSNTEIETFIHGALCVSYSGQCYFSHYIGGRSANRGECAQACRKKYTLVDENGKIIAKDKYLLSMKDFNASRHLKDLIDAGVKSFKIEGRLKDENYVKNVVAYYRQEIDKFARKTSSGKVFSDFEPDVRKSFNRGFTDYFLDGRKKCFNFESPKSLGEKLGKITKVGKDCFELNAEVSKQDGLYFNGQGCLVNKVEGRKIYPNKMDGIAVGIDVYRNFDSRFEKQLENSKIKRRIGVKFVCKNGVLNAQDEDGNFVVFVLPQGEMPKNSEKMRENFINQLKKTGESDFYTENTEIIGELPFMPVSKINEVRRKILSDLMNERLKNYKRDLQKPLKYAEFPQKELDYRANIHNSEAKCFYENSGCKVCEMSAESGAFPKELMRTKHCLKFAFNMCKSPEKLFLIDEKGKKYPLKFDCANCEMVISAS